MTKLKELFRLVIHGQYDISTKKGIVLERNRRIALTAITGVIAKVLAMGIPLFTVKVTYSYLGEEIYGLWSAITSFFSLFQFADLGLGNGLKTKLSQAYGKGDLSLSKKLVSSTYMILMLVSGILLILFLIIYPFINWAKFMNAETEKAIVLAGSVVFAIVIPKILNIPLALVQRTQMALQEGYKSNIWQSVAYFLSLISVYVIAKLDTGPLSMIWTSSMIVVIVSGLNMLTYHYIQKKELKPSFNMVDSRVSKIMFRTGSAFFILSILTTFGLALDNFIVARTISLSDAATYSILYKVTNMIGGITSMLSMPMWAANGEAFAKGDIKWIKDSTRKMMYILLGISGIASVLLIIIARPFFAIWLGNSFSFSIFLLIGMCLTQIILSVTTSYFMVLNALGIVRQQIIVFSVYTSISFILKYLLATYYGINAIPWVGFISYLLLVFIPIYYIANKRIKSSKEI